MRTQRVWQSETISDCCVFGLLHSKLICKLLSKLLVVSGKVLSKIPAWLQVMNKAVLCVIITLVLLNQGYKVTLVKQS